MSETEIDLTRSKRPIKVPDSNDAARAHLEIARIGQEIHETEDLEKILEASDDYQRVRRLSEKRVLEIIEKSLEIPLTTENIGVHCEIRGRIGERFRIMKELEGIKIFREDILKPEKSRRKKALSNITESMNRRKGKTHAPTD